jgi:hypothetical protein
LRQYLDALAAASSHALAQRLQREVGGTAEVIFVVEAIAHVENSTQFHVHAPVIRFPIRIDRRRSYPRNALVRVTVRLENVSGHTVLVSGNNPAMVVVSDASHQVVYWPDAPFMGQELFGQSMARRPTIHLRPHHHLARSFFVILRGPFLQAQATLGAPAKESGILVAGSRVRSGCSVHM